GEHDDRDVTAAAQLPAQLQAVLVGQGKLEQHQVPPRVRQGGGGGPGVLDLVAGSTQRRGQRRGQPQVVVDEQQSHVLPHVLLLRSPPAVGTRYTSAHTRTMSGASTGQGNAR